MGKEREVIDYDFSYYRSDRKVEVLLSWIKPGKVLPPLANFLQQKDYVHQPVTENYIDKLSEGKRLILSVHNWIGELNSKAYLRFEGNERLHRIYQIMCNAITCCCLDLEFENCNDKGLLIHNYLVGDKED